MTRSAAPRGLPGGPPPPGDTAAVMASGIKRQHEPPCIVGGLLQSEIAETQARSIRYPLTIAKLPLAKDLDDVDFTGTPINAGLVRDLATGVLWPIKATSFWSAAPEPANRTLPSPSPGRAPLSSDQWRTMARSATAPAGASRTSSIWSTGWRPRPAAANRAAWPMT